MTFSSIKPSRDAQLVCGVADADVDGVLAGSLKSPFAQPHRQSGAATGRVHHKVGGHKSRFDAVARVQQYTGDPLRGTVVTGRRHAPAHDLDVAQRGGAAADLPFQLRPARHVGGELLAQVVRRAEHVARGTEVDAVRPVLQNRYAGSDHVVEQTGEQRAEFLGAAGHQNMHMLALRDRRPIHRSIRQVVTLEHRHPVEEVG